MSVLALLQEEGPGIAGGVAAVSGLLAILVVVVIVVVVGLLGFLMPVFVFLIYGHVKQINNTLRTMNARNMQGGTSEPGKPRAKLKSRNKPKPGQSFAEAVLELWNPPDDLEITEEVYDMIEQCRQEKYSVEQTVDHLEMICQIEDFE